MAEETRAEDEATGAGKAVEAVERTPEGLAALIRDVVGPGVLGPVSVVPVEAMEVWIYVPQSPPGTPVVPPELIATTRGGLIIGDRYFLAIEEPFRFRHFGLREDGLWVNRNPPHEVWVHDRVGCVVRVPRCFFRAKVRPTEVSLRPVLHDILSGILWDRLRGQAGRFKGMDKVRRSKPSPPAV